MKVRNELNNTAKNGMNKTRNIEVIARNADTHCKSIYFDIKLKDCKLDIKIIIILNTGTKFIFKIKIYIYI